MMEKDDICSVCIVEEWGLPVTGCCGRRCHEVCQKDGCCNSMPKKPENVCLVIDMEGFFVDEAFLCPRNLVGEVLRVNVVVVDIGCRTFFVT